MIAQSSFKSVRLDCLVEFLEHAIELGCNAFERQSPNCVVPLRHLNLNLFTNNHRFTEFVERRVASASVAPSHQCQLSVAVVSPDDSPFPPPPIWGEPIYHARTIEKLLAETPFKVTFFHDCNLWHIYDRQKCFGVQWMRGRDDYPGWESSAPLRVFLHWALSEQGLRFTHAGTLGIAGRGILLAGKGGSGKSGTVVSGILHGLDSVGDDYVLVEQLADRCIAYPLFKTLKQDLSGLRRLDLEERIASKRTANWQNKYEFSCEDLVNRPLVDELCISALVLPKVTGASRSLLRKISSQSAMLALAPASLFQLPGHRDVGVRFFSDLVRRVPCYELALSQDSAEIAATIRSLLEVDLR